KEFRLGTNYLLTAALRLENPTREPVQLPAQELVVGTATPLGPSDSGVQMAMEWYDGSKVQRVSEPWFANRTLGCFPGTPRTEYLNGNSNVAWAAVHNRFFTMLAIPPTNSPAPQVEVRRIALAPPDAADLADDPKAITNQFGFHTAA